ncbi:hypothetical protein HAX54_019978, partial [Datura stramonium]|nr:hypothetical protein [Datura stramonium]
GHIFAAADPALLDRKSFAAVPAITPSFFHGGTPTDARGLTRRGVLAATLVPHRPMLIKNAQFYT